MTINKVIIIGNLGQDPEIRKTQDGREIANFSLATSEKWFDKSTGEKKEKTEWHKISVFSQGLVDIIKQYVKKGSKLYIEGALQTRKWKDGNGIEKYSTEIVLQNYNSTLQILSGVEKEINKHSIEKGNGYAPQAEDFNDEIPF